MKTKYSGILIWYNLKGRYDLLVFNSGYEKNKFKKEYKNLYKLMEDEIIDFEEFLIETEILSRRYDIELFEEICGIKTDKNGFDYIIYNDVKIIIDNEKLDYGC